MKNIIPFILISILLFSTCKENEPTAPEDETPNSEVLAEDTIGGEGGILHTEDFELSIPPGAFISSNKIVIEEEVNSAYSAGNVAPTYKIEGKPNSFTKSIRIALKHSGNLSNENFIAIGEKSICKSLGKAIKSFAFSKAEDSAGYLVANFRTPCNSSSNDISLKKNSSFWRWIYAVSVSNIIALKNTVGYFKFIFKK